MRKRLLIWLNSREFSLSTVDLHAYAAAPLVNDLSRRVDDVIDCDRRFHGWGDNRGLA